MEINSTIVDSPMFLLVSGAVLTLLVRVFAKYGRMSTRTAVLSSALFIGAIYTALMLYTPAEFKEAALNFVAQMMGVSWLIYEFGIKKIS